MRPDTFVEQFPCSLLVALAEEGWVRGPLTEAIVRQYLNPILQGPNDFRSDCLVLGCTHLPVLIDPIHAVLDSSIAIIDSATTTATAVRQQLDDRNLLRQGDGTGTVHFLATDSAERFARVGRIFLGHALSPTDVEHVDL